MSDKVFLDSNIVVYSYSKTEPTKQLIARNLISENYSFISTQVLQELTNVLRKKFKFSYLDISNVVDESCSNNQLHTNTYYTIKDALRIAENYGFSFYDSLIISAALECDCNIIYSEDMHDGKKIDGKLLITNPFK